jgi:hypothetical protein
MYYVRFVGQYAESKIDAVLSFGKDQPGCIGGTVSPLPSPMTFTFLFETEGQAKTAHDTIIKQAIFEGMHVSDLVRDADWIKASDSSSATETDQKAP